MLAGRLHGLADPVLMVRIAVQPGTDAGWLGRYEDALHRALRDQSVPIPEVVPPGSDEDPVVRTIASLLASLSALQAVAGFPANQAGVIVAQSDDGQDVRIALPVPPRGLKSVQAQFDILLRSLDDFAMGRIDTVPVAAVLQEIRSYKLAPPNAEHFLTTARSLGIPYSMLPGNVVEFGQGAFSRRLQLTFTDQTSVIAGRIARNKFACARLLREVGIPVPRHFMVRDEQSAVSAAHKIGFPVVVKPADCDGGKGVATGLASEEEVRAAFRAATALSPNILVEKHFDGRDYRLVIQDGKMILAIERRPAGVVGDGKRSVRQLLDDLNAQRSRPGPGQKGRPPIEFDAEAVALLTGQGLNAGSIPAPGIHVPLRRAANFALGGTVKPVTEMVHPDNVKLACRAVATVGLDLAGVDLLIPDVSRSWREVGAVICEVNGQPQFGAIREPNVYALVLQGYISGNGRIPVVVVVGDRSGDAPAIFNELAEMLRKTGLRVGQAGPDGAFIDGELVVAGPSQASMASRALINDRGVDALVVHLADGRVHDTGLPFDRIDLLVDATRQDGGEALEDAGWAETLAAVAPMCRGQVCTGKDGVTALGALLAEFREPSQ